MLTYFVAFLLSASCSFVLTPLVRNLGIRLGTMDDGSEARKVHDRPIPRVGGVAIAVAFFLPVIGLFFWDNLVSERYLADAPRVAGLVLGAVGMVALGLVDDVHDLRARTKLVVQILFAVAAWFLGYQIVKIASPFGDPIALGWLSFPVTLLWIVGIVNAINLIDGLDGLASGIALFAVIILFMLGVLNRNVIVGLTAIALAGALVGFLRYNFNPASIFMGDSGSLFIGYVLAVTAISGSAKSSTVVSLTIPLLALGLPVMDTTLTVLRRFLAGKNLFAADRDHVHHRLLDRGMSHRQAVLVLYGGCAFLGLGALMLVYANSLLSAVILTVMALGALSFSWGLGYLSWEEMRLSVRYGLFRQQALRDRLDAIEKVVDAVRKARTVEEAIDRVVDLAPGIGVDHVQCRLEVEATKGPRRFEVDGPPGEDKERQEPYRLVRPLVWGLGSIRVSGFLAFEWYCPREQLHLPEAGSYDWITLVLRDRILELMTNDDIDTLGPKLTHQLRS
ncbi:MAG: undecaprenyl/decaprenyl-phosphate alpha-N-acetylglucosaminyl 1-phosphate transferase [Deltaproteobacteria bacterium]|nr:undecaprenyl/decaprenyl-phosphate alpha-N-acetylglucosaminyl 1-phosphate transferase [Deltaproteobacteria bacterium]MBW2253276.1 undecaprenyl/decaprenyl-phosphate alpha-N-acetylglucosaminyl 1-phosphate transferase [Deltaproteobacteria bacterium]